MRLSRLALILALAACPAPLAFAQTSPAEKKPVSVDKTPESLYGFSGELVGVVVAKDAEAGSVAIRVQKVTNVWKTSKAKEPGSAVGKTLGVDGVFGRFLDALLVVQPGETIMIEAKHVRGDRLQFLGEVLKKVEPVADSPAKEKETRVDTPAGDKPQEDGKFPEGLRGFRGILAGKLVSSDAEKGVLVFQATEVKRTWPKNAATNPASCKGKELTVNGISGKWLDVLLALKKGDTLEVEAFHNRGEALDFVGEWLKKIE